MSYVLQYYTSSKMVFVIKLFCYRPGKHYPQEKTITLSPKLLNLENLAIEERINRKIPTPAGVTDIPLGMGMNEDLSSSFGRHDANNDKSQTVKKIFKPIMVRCLIRDFWE